MITDNVLFAFYDLEVSPISFDILAFLVGAEVHRKRNGYASVHLVVVPADSGTGHHDNKQFDTAHGDWRMTNIVLGICGLFATCSGSTVCQTRKLGEGMEHQAGSHIFPAGYTLKTPVERHHTGWTVLAGHEGENIQFIKATDQARIYAKQWIAAHAGEKKCVPLTLREAPFGTQRNSAAPVWGEFAKRLQAEGYFPIVLRDIDKALDAPLPAFDGIAHFPEAVFNLDLRMALYELSHISAFVANGPAQACFYNRNVKFLYLVTGDWLANDPTPFNRMGIDFGEHPPFANVFQRWIWRDQTADILMEEFQSLNSAIETSIDEGTHDSLLDPNPEYRLSLTDISERFYDWSCRTYFASPEEATIAMYCLENVDAGGLDEQTALIRSATISAGRKNIAHAAELMAKCNDQFGLTADQKIQLGVWYEALGELERATELYETAYDPADIPPEIVFRLGIIYRQTDRLSDSISMLTRLANAGARTPLVHLELGITYEACERQSDALACYRRAENMGINDPEILKRKLALERAL